LATGPSRTVRELAPKVLELLPGSQSDIAKALGRRKNDGTVRRTLEHLATEGFAQRTNGRWERCQSEPDPDVAVPDDFDQPSRALFGRVVTYVRALPRELWNDEMLPTAEAYVRSKQLAREARAEIGSNGGPYNRAKTGRVYKHPGVEDARQHERDAHEYAKALLLNPESRRRAGVKGDDSGDSPFDF
jgi:phage terminase small subunit